MKSKTIILIIIIFALIPTIPIVIFLLQPRTPTTNNKLLIMTSGSMEPAIHQGDYLKIDTNISATDIQVGTKDSDNPGDIIVFYRYNELIVHRAVEKTLDSDGTNSFKTQGDNNGWPDGTPVKESNIVGKVIEIIPASDQ